MTRGKGEEKMMGPMFPRLHVNDTEKGGPRAPPRNKMALYEQLSIPSQRFNHAMPHNNTSTNFAPPSSQGSGNEMCKFFSGQLPPRRQSDTQNSPYTDINSPLTQVDCRAKSDEDDFRVPIFTNPFPSQESLKYTNEANIEKPVPSKASYFSHALKYSKANDSTMVTMEQETINETCENPKELLVVKAASNSLVTKKNESPKKQINSSLFHEQGNYHDLSNVTESHGDGSYGSMDPRSFERADSVSETSVVDSVSVQDMITPDDVVGIIGQKHFWKARRAISNQQRVFAFQVFELHRLLKVQKLIAASPNQLIEDSPYFRKPVKPLPMKKLPSDYPVKEIINIPNHKSDSNNQTQKKECSAENIIEKTSLSSAQNAAQPPGAQPLVNNSPALSINSDHHANPWCFNQPHGQQWLIPVMSPSEGLIYKPYPAPGFMGPAHGPPGPNPPAGNFYPPPYPPPHPQYHQFPTFPGPHGYFPPYRMPMMNGPVFSGSSVDQTNPSAINAQFSAGKANVSIPNPKPGGFPNTPNVNGSEDAEVQASTASSRCEVPLGFRARSVSEGRNALKLFPTSPINELGDKSGPRPSEPERPTRVIRVVPHNARTASESAARIFQSIQEERKQHDSV